MTTPVPTRFSEEDLALIDDLVAQGIGDSRSAVIRQAVTRLLETIGLGHNEAHTLATTAHEAEQNLP